MRTFTVYLGLCVSIIMPALVAFSQTDVLTQHNDLARTGWNKNETILNHSNVNATNFGLLSKLLVDDQVFAQPLVVSNVTIGGGTHNVVYVCTVNNSVYAFDADNGTQYWNINYTNSPSGPYRVVNAGDIHPGLCGGAYTDFSGNFGIVGTPVIDKATNTMYFVTKVVLSSFVSDSYPSEYSYPSTSFFQYIHAVDLSTGAEKFNSPQIITASYNGTGDGSSGGVIHFDPRRQFNRGGLVLSNGIVYIPYAAHCDWNPSHGWLIGYNASNLTSTAQIAYNSTPNDGRGGIWMSGGAPAVDASGSLYFTTGNSNSNYTIPHTGGVNIYYVTASNIANRGQSVVKVTPNVLNNTATSLTVTSFFTPRDYWFDNQNDLDFPIQIMLLPNTNTAFTGCKDGNLYLMDQTNLGGFDTLPGSNQVLQTVPVPVSPFAPAGNTGIEMHSNFAYFGGSDQNYVYQLSENTDLTAYAVAANGLFGAQTVVSNSNWPNNGTGAGGFMSVSSNSTDTSTGILWLCSTNGNNGCDGAYPGCPAVLRAIKANNINVELWNSNKNASDYAGTFQKMNCPTISNGKVYQASSAAGSVNQVLIYGILSTPRCDTNVAINRNSNATSTFSASNKSSFAFDGDPSTKWSSIGNSNTQSLGVDLGQSYNICEVNISWSANVLGQNFTIDVSPDSSTWTTIQSFTGNASYYNKVNGSFHGRYVRMNGTLAGSNLGFSITEMQVLGTPASSPLPVNLISFTANNINNTYTLLKWETSNEISSGYFDVERSSDGAVFSSITQVKAAGNSNVDQNYTAKDDHPINGLNYYRLKQVDINGNFQYSNIVTVNFNRSAVPHIAPNPANSYFNVIAGSDPVQEISLFDVSGKILQHIINNASSSIYVPTAGLAAGIYIVTIKTNSEVYQQKLLKQ